MIDQANEPSAKLLAAIESAGPTTAPQDKLDVLRDECRRLRDDDLEISDLEARLDAAQSRRTMRVRETVPDLMDQAGVSRLELVAEGNAPAVTVEVKPFYSANIAAKWTDEKKQAAFDWLDANGCGDLVKTVVTARFAREDRARAAEAVTALRGAGVVAEIGMSVAAPTLTAWLRERHRASLPLPPLERDRRLRRACRRDKAGEGEAVMMCRPPFHHTNSHTSTMHCASCDHCFEVPLGAMDRAVCYCGRPLSRSNHRRHL